MQTIQSQLNILAKCAGHLNSKITEISEIQHPVVSVEANDIYTDLTLKVDNKEDARTSVFRFDYMGTKIYDGIIIDKQQVIEGEVEKTKYTYIDGSNGTIQTLTTKEQLNYFDASIAVTNETINEDSATTHPTN